MSAAERKRRSRERQQATGIKAFQMQVEGLHLQAVELTAARTNVSAGAALRMILEPALDRYTGLMHRCLRMIENGATDEEIAQFMDTHWMPELPPIPEKNGQ
ncbi:hypothetical protein [Duganella sp. LjRoot269]|uniref:hypothetical protein n=1 Tax=Duganella sp. LjRoot269 TaxID=3342305 RepID=UPI003ECC35EC